CSPQLSVCVLIVASSFNGIQKKEPEVHLLSHSRFQATAACLDLRQPAASSLAGHSHGLQILDIGGLTPPLVAPGGNASGFPEYVRKVALVGKAQRIDNLQDGEALRREQRLD